MTKEHSGITKVIRKYGYEYTLVEAIEREKFKHLKPPSFMGNKGYVLQSFKKVKK